MTARVLITGGASGLGLALAKQFIARGDRVVVGDLADERPDSVPNGVDYLRVIDINLLGVVRGCQTFTPMLKQQRSGHIVNTASLAGLIHGPGMSSYNAAKAGVVALSETLRFELAPWDIKVSAICPAFFRTNLHQSLQGKDVAMEETAVQLITKAGMSADEVAATVIKGIDANRAIILTDRQGHLATFAKRYVRPAYNRWGMKGGARLANRRVGANAPREGSEA